jgi:hypothetical protein
MKRGHARFAQGAPIMLALSLAACAGRSRPLDHPNRWREGECRARFTLAHEDSPLTELLELGGGRDSPQDRFPAAVIDPAAQRPVTATAEIHLDGRPIAWFSPMLDAVVVDGAAFAPLRRIDATTTGADAPRVVGRVVPRARQTLGERTLVELLLRIGAIQSYWHVGADLCLVSEEAHDGTHRMELRGVHHSVQPRRRFGSRTIETPFAFAVEIDREGQISVVAP